MIYIGKHSKKFENEFCNIVLNKVGKIEDVKEFVFECKKFIPKEIIDVDDTNEFLRQLILLPYCKIEQIYNCITNDFKMLYNSVLLRLSSLLLYKTSMMLSGNALFSKVLSPS